MIRDEAAGDAPAVRAVVEEAFASPLEAGIVDALRADCDDRLSLVAEEDGGIVGHILFTPVEIESAAGPLRGYGLAPMAVRSASTMSASSGEPKASSLTTRIAGASSAASSRITARWPCASPPP